MDKFVIFVKKVLLIVVLEVFYNVTYSVKSKVSQTKIKLDEWYILAFAIVFSTYDYFFYNDACIET